MQTHHASAACTECPPYLGWHGSMYRSRARHSVRAEGCRPTMHLRRARSARPTLDGMARCIRVGRVTPCAPKDADPPYICGVHGVPALPWMAWLDVSE